MQFERLIELIKYLRSYKNENKFNVFMDVSVLVDIETIQNIELLKILEDYAEEIKRMAKIDFYTVGDSSFINVCPYWLRDIRDWKKGWKYDLYDNGIHLFINGFSNKEVEHSKEQLEDDLRALENRYTASYILKAPKKLVEETEAQIKLLKQKLCTAKG